MTRITVLTNVVGAVSSVFGRTGVVVAQSGDYTAAQVGAVPSVFGRTGAISAQSGDYTAAQVGAVPSVFGRTGAISAQSGDYTAAQVTGALADSRGTTDQDLLVFSSGSSTFVRLGVGATAQRLIVRSDGTLKYTDPPTIPFSAYTPAANGVTNDSAKFATAITAANANQAVLELDANKTYFVDLTVATTGLSPTDGVTIKGQGRSTIIKAGPNSNAAVQTQLFTLSGSDTVTFQDIQLQGPSAANLAVGQTIDGIKHNGTAPGKIRLRGDVYINQFRYACFCPGFSSGGTTVATCTLNAGIDADGFEINGLGGTKASMGFLAQAATGTVSIRNGYIHHCGLASDIHQQGIYIGRGYDSTIYNVRIDFHFGGRGIQFEDQIDDLTTNGKPSNHQKVDKCWFGPNFDGSTTSNSAIMTGSAGKTTITNSTFALPKGRCILTRGRFFIGHCTFTEDINDSTAWIIQASDTALGVGAGYPSPFNPISDGEISDCTFRPTSALYDIQIPGSTTAAHNIRANFCKHEGGTTDAHYRIDSGASGATLVINNPTCNGTSTAGTIDVWCKDGTLVVVNEGQFIATAANHKAFQCDTNIIGRLVVTGNNFSQSGASVTLTTAPTNQLFDGNYGSKGYASRTGGTASVADGGTISHLLANSGTAKTPTKYSVTPTVANHIAAVTAVSTTTLTVALKVASTGAAVAVGENVVWTAEL